MTCLSISVPQHLLFDPRLLGDVLTIHEIASAEKLLACADLLNHPFVVLVEASWMATVG
jgi:hypothetical protein